MTKVSHPIIAIPANRNGVFMNCWTTSDGIARIMVLPSDLWIHSEEDEVIEDLSADTSSAGETSETTSAWESYLFTRSGRCSLVFHR